MKTGILAFPKKRNKINFAEQNIIKEKFKESTKNISNVSTFDSNCYSLYFKKNKNQKLFLDYTFQENKNNLKEKKENNLKIKNYYYELKKTFVLNIDLLIYFYKNKGKEENENIKEINNEILRLLNDIKKKEIIKKEIKLSINQKCNALIKKYDNLSFYHNKFKNQINIYNIKINNKLNQINQMNSYISLLISRFSCVDIYIKKLRFVSEGKKGLKHNRHKLKKCIEQNNKNILKKKAEEINIKKIKAEISELKKDNKLLRRQNKLFKEKNPNINLIRVVEFYIRIIRAISLRNKSLKNSINSLCKTLEFLDLNQIKDFTEYKRTRQKSSYEIEFSDLENNYYEENKNYDKDKNKYCINNISKNFDKFMDFSQIFNI